MKDNQGPYNIFLVLINPALNRFWTISESDYYTLLKTMDSPSSISPAKKHRRLSVFNFLWAFNNRHDFIYVILKSSHLLLRRSNHLTMRFSGSNSKPNCLENISLG